MAKAEQIRQRIYDFLISVGRNDAGIIVSNDIPPAIEGEVRKIIGPSFDRGAALMVEKDAELLNAFEKVVSLSEKRRKESPPPFALWAIDIASGAIESGKTVEHIANNDFTLMLNQSR